MGRRTVVRHPNHQAMRYNDTQWEATVKQFEIRADYDATTIVVYQAYSPAIALPAVASQHFVTPFSFTRMTWIKPSFLWMMERSNWGHKAGQEHVLAIRITRAGWEEALGNAVLSTPERHVYHDSADWKAQKRASSVTVQWDPERTLRGAALPYRSIQVGISHHLIRRYAEEWITQIIDLTPLVRKWHDLIRDGYADNVPDLLPKERLYPTPTAIAKRLGMD